MWKAASASPVQTLWNQKLQPDSHRIAWGAVIEVVFDKLTFKVSSFLSNVFNCLTKCRLLYLVILRHLLVADTAGVDRGGGGVLGEFVTGWQGVHRVGLVN